MLKLHRPSITPDIINRPRVNKILYDNAFKRMVLVCAPAGYGKSMAISQWLEQQERKYAWLSMEESFNDISAFINSLKAALDTLAEETNVNRSVEGATDSSGKDANYSLLKKIESIRAKSILILDDYQIIRDAKVNALMDTLLDYWPATVQLILISKRDPGLSTQKLRLYGGMVDIRMRDLALDADELQQMLTRSGHSNLPTGKTEELLAWTEGWVLGVKIALSIPSLSDGKLPLKNSASLFQDIDFFVEHLISNLQPDISAMISTIALCDRFNESLINDLMRWRGITSMDGKHFLDQLRANNLFIIDLDGEDAWYRFHHLFQDLLAKKLMKENQEYASRALHQVSAWFINQGFLEEGFQLAIKAQDYALAADLIVTHRHAIFDEDKWYVVHRWIGSIPEKIWKSNINLLLAQLWIYENTFQIRELSATLSIIEEMLDQRSDKAIVSEFYFHKGWQEIYVKVNPENALKCLEKSKRFFEGNKMLYARRELYIAMARQMLGKVNEALRDLDKIEQAFSPTDLMYLRMSLSKLLIMLVDGQFDKSVGISEKASFLTGNSSYEAIKAYGWYYQGNIAFQRNNLNVADHALKVAMSFQGVQNLRVLLDALAGFCLFHSINMDGKMVEVYLERFESYFEKLQEIQYQKYLTSIRNRMMWHRGAGEEQLDWALQNWEKPPPSEYLFAMDCPAFTKMRILLTYGNQDIVEQCLQYIHDTEKELHQLHNHYHDSDITIMKAVGALRKSDMENARQYMAKAIEISNTQGIFRPLIEWTLVVPDVLDMVNKSTLSPAFQSALEGFLRGNVDTPSRSKDQFSLDALTIRESEIVNMIAKGLRNKEIANQLHIAEVTVKSHLTHIYRKLDVSSRTRMLKKVREMKTA